LAAPNKNTLLIEGEDYYWSEQGQMVLTAQYLLKRGYCCGLLCCNCPYGTDIQSAAAKQRKNRGTIKNK